MALLKQCAFYNMSDCHSLHRLCKNLLAYLKKCLTNLVDIKIFEYIRWNEKTSWIFKFPFCYQFSFKMNKIRTKKNLYHGTLIN